MEVMRTRIRIKGLTLRYAGPDSVDDYIIRVWRRTEYDLIQFAEEHFKKSWGTILKEGWRVQPISITFNPHKIHNVDVAS